MYDSIIVKLGYLLCEILFSCSQEAWWWFGGGSWCKILSAGLSVSSVVSSLLLLCLVSLRLGTILWPYDPIEN